MVQLPCGTNVENWTSKEIIFSDPVLDLKIKIPAHEEGPAHSSPFYVQSDESRYVHKTKWKACRNLPEKREGVLLIVSKIVKIAEPDRDDLVVPCYVSKDDKGQAVSCGGFSK